MKIYHKNQLKEYDLIKTRKYMVYVLSSIFLYLRQTSLINCRADKTAESQNPLQHGHYKELPPAEQNWHLPSLDHMIFMIPLSSFILWLCKIKNIECLGQVTHESII